MDNSIFEPISEDVISSIMEAPGDENEGGNDNNVDLAADDNTNNDNQNADDNNADNDTDENNDQDQENQNDENRGDQTNDDNFDIDDNDQPPENDEGDNDNPEPTTDNNEEGSENDISAEEKDENAEKDKIYVELTPAERQRMDLQLRDQFKELYYDIGGIIEDSEKFPNTRDSIEIMDRLLKNLRNFKKYIVYYLSNIYDTKSDIENKIVYTQYIQIYLGIKSIYDDLRQGLAHTDDIDEEK